MYKFELVPEELATDELIDVDEADTVLTDVAPPTDDETELLSEFTDEVPFEEAGTLITDSEFEEATDVPAEEDEAATTLREFDCTEDVPVEEPVELLMYAPEAWAEATPLELILLSTIAEANTAALAAPVAAETTDAIFPLTPAGVLVPADEPSASTTVGPDGLSAPPPHQNILPYLTNGSVECSIGPRYFLNSKIPTVNKNKCRCNKNFTLDTK